MDALDLLSAVADTSDPLGGNGCPAIGDSIEFQEGTYAWGDWDCSDTGVMYCTSGLFEALREAAQNGEHGLSAGLARLAAKGRAHVVDVTGCWWLDVDTPEARLLAERYLADRLRSIG